MLELEYKSKIFSHYEEEEGSAIRTTENRYRVPSS
jgi:hypothetical protein